MAQCSIAVVLQVWWCYLVREVEEREGISEQGQPEPATGNRGCTNWRVDGTCVHMHVANLFGTMFDWRRETSSSPAALNFLSLYSWWNSRYFPGA